MYVGDGINDLVALAAADVGMAVGSSSASAAAAISDQHASVEGMFSAPMISASCVGRLLVVEFSNSTVVGPDYL